MKFLFSEEKSDAPLSPASSHAAGTAASFCHNHIQASQTLLSTSVSRFWQGGEGKPFVCRICLFIREEFSCIFCYIWSEHCYGWKQEKIKENRVNKRKCRTNRSKWYYPQVVFQKYNGCKSYNFYQIYDFFCCQAWTTNLKCVKMTSRGGQRKRFQINWFLVDVGFYHLDLKCILLKITLYWMIL